MIMASPIIVRVGVKTASVILKRYPHQGAKNVIKGLKEWRKINAYQGKHTLIPFYPGIYPPKLEKNLQVKKKYGVSLSKKGAERRKKWQKYMDTHLPQSQSYRAWVAKKYPKPKPKGTTLSRKFHALRKPARRAPVFRLKQKVFVA